MVVIRSSSDIVLGLIDYLRVAQPDASTISGSVIRDLMIDMPASQIALLYDEVSKISSLQSLRLAIGTDLDRLAQNYGATRKTSAKSSGISIITFSSIPATINIDKGGVVYASNGSSFSVVNGLSVSASNSNLYKSVATKYKNDLDFLNISDQYAVEVTTQATSPGSAGNIGKYSIVRTSIPGASNVFNALPFSGGSDQESDAAFRERVLAIFSGSNTGTSLGYKNAVISDSNVLDAVVIGPGDPLMQRDGTQVAQNTDGTYNIVSEGSGGKVDIIILGNNLSEYTDTFIYQDKSNNNNPSNSKNDVILGQISSDSGKTISRKRIDDFTTGILPAQPVDEILSVSGSLSGSNFTPKQVDSLGRISGNYEILKDTGYFAGSSFGMDKFHWINDRILFSEDRIKNKFNGQDTITFSDVIDIPVIKQNISILNENSTVLSSDRSLIKLSHTPASNVTRVFNVNTGERYTVTNQNNVNGVNSTGIINIAGNTLPSVSDILQVDYTWLVSYDPYVDYDGKYLNNNPREISDSIDWGYSNFIVNEDILFTKDGSGNFYSGIAKHTVGSVISANTFAQSDSTVSVLSTGNFAGRLAVIISASPSEAVTIESIVLKNSSLEVFNTINNDYTIINDRIIVGASVKYNITIVLPTDSPAVAGQSVTTIFNTLDVFSSVISGNFVNNILTIPTSNFPVSTANTIHLKTVYVANIQEMLSGGITNFPISKISNGFSLNNGNGSLSSNFANVIRTENQTVQQNVLSEFYITLNVSANEFNVNADKIISVIRLSDNLEIWNSGNKGTVGTDSNNNYTLIFSGFNTPAISDKVLVVYLSDDIKRFQPFTFDNKIIKNNFNSLNFDSLNNYFYFPIFQFSNVSSATFSVIDPTTNISLASGTDGYLSSMIGSPYSATLSSVAVNFGSISDILYKKISIKDNLNPDNNGIFDIVSYNSSTDTITIKNDLTNVNINQISVYRIKDGKNIWTSSCSIDLTNNKLIIPNTPFASDGDEVFVVYFNYQTLRQSPSKIGITLTDQINTSGSLTISGTTVTKVDQIVFNATNSGLKQNVSSAIKTYLTASSVYDIPSNISLARVVKLEKVNVTTNGEVISVINTYDILGSGILNDVFYSNESIHNNSIGPLDFVIPSTANNLNNNINVGDALRITFYYTTSDDSENIFFTKNGTVYTNKTFALVNKIFVSSGFKITQSARFSFSNFNQPLTGSRYSVSYNYLAPKQNERIIVKYNYNRLIGDAALNVESVRPINADVIVKAAKQILIDTTINIVVLSSYVATGSQDLVLQNVKNKIISAINTNKLNDTLDSSDLIAVAQTVDGVDRARIVYFNVNGSAGNKLSILANKDQYFSANNVVINVETR